MDLPLDEHLAAVRCVNSVEAKMREQVGRKVAKRSPWIDKRTRGNCALAVNARRNGLLTINFNLAERVLEVVCGVIIAPWVPGAIDKSYAFISWYVFARKELLERDWAR